MIFQFAFSLALIAVVVCVILIQPTMLFGPLYQRLQAYTVSKYNKYPEEIYWLKPLISCVLCVAGQWCFWGYIIKFYTQYSILEHIYTTALGIFIAAVLRKIYLWSKM